jgi:hypothetical protein
MAVQGRKRSGKNIVSLLLASTILGYVGVMAVSADAEAQQGSAVASATVGFNIPAQPLGKALNSFIKSTGWQIGYSSALVDGKQSTIVSGKLTPESALRTLLSGTGIEIRMTGPKTASLLAGGQAAAAADGATLLEAIRVESKPGQSVLGTSSIADTGTTTISGGQLNGRTGGSGDANSVLRNLANVQYQNEINTDAGETDQSVIDLKPKEVSISGARVYENNFILNGMEINNVAGSVDQFRSDSFLVTSNNFEHYQLFGLHSQTVFVPTDFVASTTVIDSNASARYGNFQGGVILYDLEKPSTDRWRASVTTDYTTSDWAKYNLLTPTGLNTSNVSRNDYIRRRSSVSVTGPVTDNIAVIGQYSTQSAITHKDKQKKYVGNQRTAEESESNFYRLQAVAETDLGEFTLEGIYNTYGQEWESALWRDTGMTLGKDGLTTKLQHDYAFEDFSLGGVAFNNVKLKSILSYNKSKFFNDGGENEARLYTQNVFRSGAIVWNALEISDWCQSQPGMSTATSCIDGGWGYKEQGQEQWSLSEELTGDVLLGSFRLGAEYTSTEAHRRRPEEYTYHTVSTVIFNSPALSGFICNGADNCSSEQYSSRKTVYGAYDISTRLNQFNIYSEIDQTWKWFNVRAGLRASYDDYMKNLEVSPRVVATLTPFEDFSISAGFNRYYNATNLAYALRERIPRSTAWTRNHNTSTGAVNGWVEGATQTPYENYASDLKTPYNDEITFGLSGKEPLLDGDWRIRFMDRRSKDQFATESLSSTVNTLTNSGHGAYQSITGEYSKDLDTANIEALDALSFNTSITWARNEVSNNTYFEDNLEDNHIYYHNQSYSEAGFSVVTGNMDIPLRLQAGFASSWFDNRLNVDVSANYNFAFRGVRDTGDTIDIDGLEHAIYEDHDFSPTVTVDLATSYEVYKNEDRGLMLNMKIGNLFNETGNVRTGVARPWSIGRTIWVGAKATF